MRIFVAVFPPAESQALAAGLIDTLRRPADGVSWVKPDNLHYTFRFLGELGEDGARRVGEAVFEAAAAVPAFEAVLGAPGAFPSARAARVLWLGLSAGEEPFRALARRLEKTLARRGFAPEGHPFAPHLTLGRVRNPGHDWGLALSAAGSLAAFPAARFPVRALAVVESTLSPKGSIYRVRQEGVLPPPV